jgi:methylated-DNA-[protein]-cysteine S-methyltransferase
MDEKRHVTMDSPIGRLLLRGTRTSLTAIEFAPKGARRAEHPAGIASKPPFRQAIRQLEAYFRGELRDFDLPLEPRGTEFQRRTWEALRSIPYGETISYAELARRVGNPRAARAVGTANGANPLPIVIPCHRVIGSNGKLAGYGGGLGIKEKLLVLEGALLV